MSSKPARDQKPTETTADDPAVTHEELAAAAMAELIEEQKQEGGEGAGKKPGPPDWFRKVYENT